MNCLLCHSQTTPIASDVFTCTRCGIVFKNPVNFLKAEEDFERYSQHRNDSNDPGYVKFLNKVIEPLKIFLPEKFSSLDYGCGPGPTLSLLLQEEGGDTFDYDPLFFQDLNLLQKKYEVVTSTEVVEHFKNPKVDWDQLVSLVKPGGLLGIMTQFHLIDSEESYKSWWYKNDPTHVVFYNEKAMHYLAEMFGLEILFNDKVSVVLFRKK
jgi:hypothetical protein